MNQNSYYYSAYPYDRNSNMTSSTYYPTATDGSTEDDRFFLAPFVVGGLAGTALGYGLANNNQINNNNQNCCMQPMFFYPVNQQMPMSNPYMFSNTNSNNFFY